MVKGCGNASMKYILFCVNLLIFALSVAILGLSIYVLVQSKGISGILSTPDAATIAALSINLFAILMAFLGCCGAVKENTCMLYLYAIIVGLIAIAQMAIAIAVFVYSSKVSEEFEKEFKAGLDRYKEKGDNQEGIDLLQSVFQCCGYKSATEWGTTRPKSCCGGFDPLKPDESKICAPTDAYQVTCESRVPKFFKSLSIWLGVILMLLGALNVMATCFACAVAKADKF